MAGLDKLIGELAKNRFATGAAVGLGAALLAPAVLSGLARVARPLAKGAIKAGVIAYEKGREGAAEFGELIEDAVAEARDELGYGAMTGVSAYSATKEESGEPAEAGKAGEAAGDEQGRPADE
jgi:hypothetical protein